MSSFKPATSMFLTTLLPLGFLAASTNWQGAEAALVTVQPKLSFGVSGNAEKPRIVSTSSGALIIAYGDSEPDSEPVYDLKAAGIRAARDVFIQTCTPSALRTCDRAGDWSLPKNQSRSAKSSSISVRHQGAQSDRAPHPGDIDKVNIRSFGPVVVLSWASKFCPEGDVLPDGTRPIQQRARTYFERDGRELPFSCVWLAYSVDEGANWSKPVQRSTGQRDAIQDVVVGGFNETTRLGWFAQIWQEDPQGLMLGEAEGPGDGASGARVSGGTDLWYALARVDLSERPASVPAVGLEPAVRLTAHHGGNAVKTSEVVSIVDAAGTPVPVGEIETGPTGASRPTAASSGSTVILVYEQSRGGRSGAASTPGKLVRFHAFDYRKAKYNPNDPSSNQPDGCVISDPGKNARRARVVAQSPEQAGSDQVLAAVFWREGLANQGGPADIMLRRLVGGTGPEHLDPPVDASCAGGSSGNDGQRAENISSNTPHRDGSDRLADTEEFPMENAIAHRAILRGSDLWLGYLYVPDIERLKAGQQSYEFWLGRYSPVGGWSVPRNISRTGNPGVNVREPRLIGAPRSARGCPSGEPLSLTTVDATACQSRSAIWAAWGMQSNEPVGSGTTPRDLGIKVTHSTDSGANFSPPTELAFQPDQLEDDDVSAFETQMVIRPDGRRFRGVWTRRLGAGGPREVVYVSGYLPEPMELLSASPEAGNTPPSSTNPAEGATTPPEATEPAASPFSLGSGGCSLSRERLPIDPTLPVAVSVALLAIVRAKRLMPRSTHGPLSPP